MNGNGAVDRQGSDLSPIAEFWLWWRNLGAREVAAALDAGHASSVPAVISPRVHAIDPALEWELAEGLAAQHLLVVTAAGVAEYRPLAERWLRAAPSADTVWEYRAARQPDPHWQAGGLEFAGHRIELSLTTAAISIDESAQRIDVTVFHPGFPGMAQKHRLQLTYLILDRVLGEDDVERWLGVIDAAEASPTDGLSLDALPEVVRSLAQRQVPDRWVMLQGATPAGSPLLVLARRPLRWIDHPLLDLHHVISVAYAGRREDGLPDPDALTELTDIEDSLIEQVEPQALLLAHESADGIRLMHVYSDSEDQNVTDRIDRWVRRTPNASAARSHDPSWAEVRKFG